jgi:hypothetical protein
MAGTAVMRMMAVRPMRAMVMMMKSKHGKTP